MYLGLDVGGTHTDAVIISDDFELVNAVKAPTSDDVLSGIMAAVEKVVIGVKPAEISRITVSSTLGLNSLLTGQTDPVGTVLTGGPGLAPPFKDDGLTILTGGAQDHRGEILTPLKPGEAQDAVAALLAKGAAALVAASKFGPKNPALEDELARAMHNAGAQIITQASKLCPDLNFPRRINTAVCNAAISRRYISFLENLIKAFSILNLHAPLFILKADGGAYSVDEAAAKPILALAAGPAASVMGLLASLDEPGDTLMMDVGGTTTDLAFLADGSPLLTKEGLWVAGRPTLVKGLVTKSIALGGDSTLILEGLKPSFGPRQGPALALCPHELGQRPPTLTDALNVINGEGLGDLSVSRKALELLCGGQNMLDLARQWLNLFWHKVQSALDEAYDHLQNRPVYTVDDLLLTRPLHPACLALLGGPAEALARSAASHNPGLKIYIPPKATLANAAGAALAEPGYQARLYADTSSGRLSLPGLGLQQKINSDYNLEKAQADFARHYPGAVINSAESFNRIDDYGQSRRLIRVEGGRRAALAGRLKKGGA